MDRQATLRLADMLEHVWSLPISALNVARPELFRSDTLWPYFEQPAQRGTESLLSTTRRSRSTTEEIFKRFSDIEAVGEPRRVFSTFVHGYEYLPVRLSAV